MRREGTSGSADAERLSADATALAAVAADRLPASAPFATSQGDAPRADAPKADARKKDAREGGARGDARKGAQATTSATRDREADTGAAGARKAGSGDGVRTASNAERAARCGELATSDPVAAAACAERLSR